jgi:hypothetical protein
MTAITIALLTVGAILATVGTAGFWYIANTAPNAADLQLARRLATAGRWAAGIGLSQICAEPTRPGGIALGALLVVAMLAVASLITKAPINRPTTAGAA